MPNPAKTTGPCPLLIQPFLKAADPLAPRIWSAHLGKYATKAFAFHGECRLTMANAPRIWSARSAEIALTENAGVKRRTRKIAKI